MPTSRTRVEPRPETFGDCTSCNIGGTVRTCQQNLGQFQARGVWRLHKLRHWKYSSCLPGEPGPKQGSRRSKTAQTAVLTVQFVPIRRTWIKSRPQAFGDCTSCSIGDIVCARQEQTGRVKVPSVRRLHKLRHRRA